MKKRKKRTQRHWAVVATSHTLRGLRMAADLRSGDGVDLVEVRLDCLSRHTRLLPQMLRRIKLPLILTARHPEEGGAACLSARARGELLEKFMPFASMIDIELRSAAQLLGVLNMAKKRLVEVIVSTHHFSRTPSEALLRRKVRAGSVLGASIVKIAATLRDARDLATLINVQASCDKAATMGMGPLGKASRLVLPLAGAHLVYGYLDRPQVEGQWPAELLAERLVELSR